MTSLFFKHYIFLKKKSSKTVGIFGSGSILLTRPIPDPESGSLSSQQQCVKKLFINISENYNVEAVAE